MKLQFGILGPLEARRDDKLVELGPPKQRAVLAVLLISANQVVSLDRLIEMLWGVEVPTRAQGSLQAYIHNLRKVLEPGRAIRSQAQILVTRPPGYVVQVQPDEFDASQFEVLAAHGHRLLAERPAVAKEQLMEALALWRGPALAEFAFEQFAQPEAARLEEVRAVAQEDLLEAELALGNHATAIGDITVAVGSHPLRERLWSLLMLALYRSGRQGEALRAFAMARHTLAEELGIDPSPALRSLEASILAQSPDLEFYRDEPWSRETLSQPTSARLVAWTPKRAPLVGRENQLKGLITAISRAEFGHGGVVLISGESGVGKTRLAEEVAAESERRNFQVVWGRAHEREGAPPGWLWIQVAGDVLRQFDPELLAEALAGRAAVLRPLLPEGDALPGPDSPSGRFALFEAMTGFLVRLAEDGAMVVVLEDLQWADQQSLQLLEHLAARFQTSHVLVVATCQPWQNYRETPLTETVGALARLPYFDWIELDGLSCPEVGRLIAQSGARASPDQVREIHARTGGNPFFASHLARLLATGDAQCPCRPGQVPNTVRAVIRHWLSRLPDQTHRLLVVAAAMGRDFDVRAVAAASGVNIDDAVQWMHAAVMGGIVMEDAVSPGCYRFCHGLVQDTLLEQVPGLHMNTLRAFATQAGAERDQPNPDRREEACG